MRKIRRLVSVLALLSLLVSLSLTQGLAQPLQPGAVDLAAPQHIVYNLYATDGWVNLADGNQFGFSQTAAPGDVGSTPLYIYGYVGGRQTTPATPYKFLESSDPEDPYAPQDVETIAGGVPAPTGGSVLSPAEAALQGNAQFPAPIMYARVGDVVEIRLKNLGVTNPLAANDPHSIHLHALDVDAANDGVPETSVAAVPANLCADGSTAPVGTSCATPYPGAGNVVVYMFSPTMPGTYFYHCHQEADIHVTMGMYGALVVYNTTDAAAATGPGMGKGGNLWGYTYDKDYVLMISDTDVRQHMSESGEEPYNGANIGTFNPTDYRPQYWFINGLSFPNTIHADVTVPKPTAPGSATVVTWANWNMTHPGYDPFITGRVNAPGPGNGDRILLRMINMGYETQPMHMHGFHAKVLGSDQRPWTFANTPATPPGQGMEKNTTTIGSGETYELLLKYNVVGSDAAGCYPNNILQPGCSPLGWLASFFTGGTQSRNNAAGVPVSNGAPAGTNPAIIEPVKDEPYIGGPQVAGILGNGPGVPYGGTSSQFFPYHNHDDYKATNWGDYPGGMFTMIVTCPAGTGPCP